MKILITGATGFIGSHLVRRLATEGHDILALGKSQDPPKALLQYGEYRCHDIALPMGAVNCDAVVHSAALADDRASFPMLERVNTTGTRHVFEAVPGAGVFIHISSGSVYNCDRPVHFEHDTINGDKLFAYGRSKKLAEDYLLSQKTNNKSIVLLRPRAVYGIGDRVLLPRILALPKRNVVYLPGNKDVEVSLTHIDNLCGAVSWLLKKPPTGATVFNISDKKTYALRAILKELIEGSYAGNMTWCNLPMPLVSVLAHGFEVLGIRSNLTRQSLEYFTQSAILNTDKIERETGYCAKSDFDKEKPALMEWVKRVGLQRIAEQSRDLPWWSCKPVK